jgi:hypothetical protein
VAGVRAAAPARHQSSTADVPLATDAVRPAVSDGPAATLAFYWSAVRAHDFPAAYALLVPGSTGQIESRFVGSEVEAGITAVRFEGQVIDSSSAGATVKVASLTTDDAEFGCRRWSGACDMTQGVARWLIAHADLTVQRCGA